MKVNDFYQKTKYLAEKLQIEGKIGLKRKKQVFYDEEPLVKEY